MNTVINFFAQAAVGPTQQELMDTAIKNPPPGFRTESVVHDMVVYAPVGGAKFDVAEFRKHMAEVTGISEEMLFKQIDLVEAMRPKPLTLSQALRELGQEVQGQE